MPSTTDAARAAGDPEPPGIGAAGEPDEVRAARQTRVNEFVDTGSGCESDSVTRDRKRARALWPPRTRWGGSDDWWTT